MRAAIAVVIAGLDPAIHPVRKKDLTKRMDPRVKPAGDGRLHGARLPLTRLALSALATLSPRSGERAQTEFAARADSLHTNGIICICITTLPQGRSDESEFAA
jgi:hypothetical protein